MDGGQGQKHPHGRGEDSGHGHRRTRGRETPPQAWGRHSIVTRTLHEPRNTPTGVGKTPHRTRHRPPHRKHPHGRREDSMKRSTNAWCMETPPQEWGRPRQGAHYCGNHGNTPTGVGKTPAELHPFALVKKHPHRRGEDSFAAAWWTLTGETPPQAWGRLHAAMRPLAEARNTPTGVGKTDSRS